jgi:predicted membrane channel-forming protein YqfA (hemolysin III family)
MNQEKKWSELGAGEKTQLITAIALIAAGILLGFISFIWLQFIPGSVMAQSGIYISGALAIYGISSYFKTELNEFQTKINNKLKQIDYNIEKMDQLSEKPKE